MEKSLEVIWMGSEVGCCISNGISKVGAVLARLKEIHIWCPAAPTWEELRKEPMACVSIFIWGKKFPL